MLWAVLGFSPNDEGFIRSIHRTKEQAIQHAQKVQPGVSGAPEFYDDRIISFNFDETIDFNFFDAEEIL